MPDAEEGDLRGLQAGVAGQMPCCGPAAGADGVPNSRAPVLLDHRRVWDAATHNEFTDLVRFGGAWHLTFREAADHTSPDGKIRILSSTDGEQWSSRALLEWDGQDLRDPKLEVTPDGRLMLNAAVWLRPSVKGKRHQSLVYFSDDGSQWDGPHEIGDPNVWIWRATWHNGICYAVGYHKLFKHDFRTKPKFIRLYTSRDGLNWEVRADDFCREADFPNEAGIAFTRDDTCHCVVRCTDYDKRPAIEPACYGTARPPYTQWTWTRLDVGVGGPELLALPDDRLVAACRCYGAEVETKLCWVDRQAVGVKVVVV
jgi:hypothetical protein